jgi:hypothetical protein
MVVLPQHLLVIIILYTIPCSASPNKNKIKVTIPPRQIAPEWATHYKFVIKPDEENYDVIYSNIYYTEQLMLITHIFFRRRKH